MNDSGRDAALSEIGFKEPDMAKRYAGRKGQTREPWVVRPQVKNGPRRAGYYLARNFTENALAWAKDRETADLIVALVNNPIEERQMHEVNEMAMRLDCLRLAADISSTGSHPSQIVSAASAFYDFVSSKQPASAGEENSQTA